MALEYKDMEAATRVTLDGRLDTPGVDAVEMRFTACLVPRGRNSLVDMSQVTFLSSMGIRMLVTVAQALSHKQARMILFGAQPLVRETLENAGIHEIIPLEPDEESARRVLGIA